MPQRNKPTDDELADARGFVRLVLDQADAMEQRIQADTGQAETALDACEASLRIRLAGLYGRDSLYRRGYGGLQFFDVSTPSKRAAVERVSAQARAVIRQEGGRLGRAWRAWGGNLRVGA